MQLDVEESTPASDMISIQNCNWQLPSTMTSFTSSSFGQVTKFWSNDTRQCSFEFWSSDKFWSSDTQCFPKVTRVADHFNRVADQLPHFARPNDPQNLNWGGGDNLSEPDRVHTANMFHIQETLMCTEMQRDHA